MLLDQMIQEKVESGHVLQGDRGSLRVKRDTVMGKVEKALMAEEGSGADGNFNSQQQQQQQHPQQERGEGVAI